MRNRTDSVYYVLQNLISSRCRPWASTLFCRETCFLDKHCRLCPRWAGLWKLGFPGPPCESLSFTCTRAALADSSGPWLQACIVNFVNIFNLLNHTIITPWGYVSSFYFYSNSFKKVLCGFFCVFFVCFFFLMPHTCRTGDTWSNIKIWPTSSPPQTGHSSLVQSTCWSGKASATHDRPCKGCVLKSIPACKRCGEMEYLVQNYWALKDFPLHKNPNTFI